ncbi:hypothetical protein Sjap_014783 [Stephania japonica]|uniref:Uncharacterized protein n=1 Tax=Stephania japonica TaxID=461633 RepID=A0AAP0IHX8_9MAGN
MERPMFSIEQTSYSYQSSLTEMTCPQPLLLPLGEPLLLTLPTYAPTLVSSSHLWRIRWSDDDVGFPNPRAEITQKLLKMDEVNPSFLYA